MERIREFIADVREVATDLAASGNLKGVLVTIAGLMLLSFIAGAISC